jgi:hypothetical protein
MKEQEKQVEYLPRDEVVSCEDCKVLVKKADAETTTSFHRDVGWGGKNTTHYFCPEHKKKYQRKTTCWDKTRYYSELEVSEDGTPIGYEKINPAKK